MATEEQVLVALANLSISQIVFEEDESSDEVKRIVDRLTGKLIRWNGYYYASKLMCKKFWPSAILADIENGLRDLEAELDQVDNDTKSIWRAFFAYVNARVK